MECSPGSASATPSVPQKGFSGTLALGENIAGCDPPGSYDQSFSAGSGNWSWYCNEELDKLAAEADAITDPARAEERNKLWSDIYAKLMEDAPWAPVFNEQRFTMRSKRMAGEDALYVDPVHIPVHYDAASVN